MKSQNKVKHLIVDTSAFIKNLPLQEYAESVYTTESVVGEITSKRQLRNLVVLPYDLEIKNVCTENIKFVTEFSKKTGDYPSLSAVDIQVMALTYQLEKEHVGTDHLNSQPQILKVTNFTEKTPAAHHNIAGFYLPSSKGSSSQTIYSEINIDSLTLAGGRGKKDGNDNGREGVGQDSQDEDNIMKTRSSHEDDTEGIQEIIKSPSVERVKYEEFDEHPRPSKPVGGTNLDEDDIKEIERDIRQVLDSKKKKRNKKPQILQDPKDPKGEGDNNLSPPKNLGHSISDTENELKEEICKSSNASDSDGGHDDDDDDDIWDDDDAWITLDNLKEAQLEVGGADLDNGPALVACITGDFAMQNVLRQLGLRVLALDGRVIRTLRTYILRCYSCFKTTSKMDLLFCPHCGHKTLQRASVVLRPDGAEEILIGSRRQPTKRGKRFSLPKPQGGKHANNPLLCPDQRLPQQHISRLARTKNNPLDSDYIAGFSPFVMRDVNSKSAMLGIRNAGEIKNWMRRNPNEVWKKGKKRSK